MGRFSALGSRLGLLCFVLLAMAAPGLAFGQASPQKHMPELAFEKYTLPNGLQVILHVDRELPIVTVNQWFYVGSANERQGRSGFAHLFEHMMFQGSKNAPENFFSLAKAAGAGAVDDMGLGRGVNGNTHRDYTNYFTTLPSGNLEYLLWLESDRLATLPDALDQARLDGQILVVRNERRQSYENVPFGRALKVIFENLFPAGHPYHRDVIGLPEDIDASTLADVKAFFQTYYTPNNLSLVIAGDFEPAEAKRLVEKYFAGIEPGPALDRPARSQPGMVGEKIVEANDRITQERTYFAWQTPAYFEAGDAELDLASSILTRGVSSRLNKSLVHERRLASDVGSVQYSQVISGIFRVYATAAPGAELGELERAMTAEIGRLAREGPTPAELDRAKSVWEFALVSGLEYLSGFGGKADTLNQYNTFLGDPGKLEADFARYRNASAEGVRAAVAKYLDTPNRVVLRFHPEKSSKATGVAIDRAVVPALGTDTPFSAPTVKSATLDNGLEILVVEKPELPQVAVSLATRAGSAADPAGKAGLANLTVRLMQLGTDRHDAPQLSEMLGDLGTDITEAESNFSIDRSALNMVVLSRNLEKATGILADIAMNASLPEDDFEREKKRTLDMLVRQSDDSAAIAFRQFGAMAYGADHPYGHASGGLPDTVKTITREDAVAFHRTYWRPASSALTFVGNITLDEATAMAKLHFGGWTGGSAPAIEVRAQGSRAGGKVFLIDRPGAAQTSILQVWGAPARKSPDYFPLTMANEIYGGGSVYSRLNLNLREDKGYTYFAFSELEHYSTAGSWSVFAQVQTDKTGESAVELIKELRGISGERPITAEEFSMARLAKIRNYAQQFESYARIARQVTELWSARLPMTAWHEESTGFAKLALAQVNAAAAKYAVPADMSILFVGDLSKIETKIRALNLGEVVVLDSYGNAVSPGAAGFH